MRLRVVPRLVAFMVLPIGVGLPSCAAPCPPAPHPSSAVPSRVGSERGAPKAIPDEEVSRVPTALPKAAFLPLVRDRALRETFWRHYQRAEAEARSFVRVPEEWFPVKLVRGSDRALWVNTGLIEIPFVADDVGALFHEVFHSAHYLSPLHEGRDDWWGEGFATAFRYFMSKAMLGTSPWLRSFEPLVGQSREQVVIAMGDNDVTHRYLYPAAVIVDRSGRNYPAFRELWFELCALREKEKRDVLDAFFNAGVTR